MEAYNVQKFINRRGSLMEGYISQETSTQLLSNSDSNLTLTQTLTLTLKKQTKNVWKNTFHFRVSLFT